MPVDRSECKISCAMSAWKVRAEQARLRPDPAATITGEIINEMTFARQVVREVLRFRPPAPMVPQARAPPVLALEPMLAVQGTELHWQSSGNPTDFVSKCSSMLKAAGRLATLLWVRGTCTCLARTGLNVL